MAELVEKNGKLGDKSEYGAWMIQIIDPSGKVPPKKMVVVAASLREIVNTYDDVVNAEFLAEGGVVLTLQVSQAPEGQLSLKPQEAHV